jgi:hypothetical protein
MRNFVYSTLANLSDDNAATSLPGDLSIFLPLPPTDDPSSKPPNCQGDGRDWPKRRQATSFWLSVCFLCFLITILLTTFLDTQSQRRGNITTRKGQPRRERQQREGGYMQKNGPRDVVGVSWVVGEFFFLIFFSLLRNFIY